MSDLDELKSRVHTVECDISEVKRNFSLLNQQFENMAERMFEKLETNSKQMTDVQLEIKQISHAILKSMMLERDFQTMRNEINDLKIEKKNIEKTVESLSKFRWVLTGIGFIISGLLAAALKALYEHLTTITKAVK